MQKLRIDIWSDIACPWCYVGKRRLEGALSRFEHRAAVEIVWRAFELNPAAPRVEDSTRSYAERLAKKYGTSPAQAESMIARMTETARADGLDFHFERIRPGNTFDAHRVLHLASDRGVQGAVKERFLHGYMTEGAAIGEQETLLRLGAEAGLDVDELQGVLASDAFATAVREDEAHASELGIHGVPFFVLAGRSAIEGAQPTEVLLRALEDSWRHMSTEPRKVAEGEVCGPDGCD